MMQIPKNCINVFDLARKTLLLLGSSPPRSSNTSKISFRLFPHELLSTVEFVSCYNDQMEAGKDISIIPAPHQVILKSVLDRYPLTDEQKVAVTSYFELQEQLRQDLFFIDKPGFEEHIKGVADKFDDMKAQINDVPELSQVVTAVNDEFALAAVENEP